MDEPVTEVSTRTLKIPIFLPTPVHAKSNKNILHKRICRPDRLGRINLSLLPGISADTRYNKGLIYYENYGQVAAISIIGKKYKLPELVSFSDIFIYRKPVSNNLEITRPNRSILPPPA